MSIPQNITPITLITNSNTVTSVGIFAAQSRFDVSVEGTISAGAVNLQRSFDNGNTWYTVNSYTAVGESVVINVSGNTQWRFQTNGSFSGSVSVRASA